MLDLSMEGLCMSGTSASDSLAWGRWFGILGSWLPTWSSEVPQSSRDLPRESGRPRAHPRSSVRVLVVDDDPANLRVIAAQIRSRGLVPVLAADGAAAVALARETQFDLILMDLLMPVLDGWEATAAIRRFEASGSRPAVPVVTYSSVSQDAGILARHGMNGSLAKPCSDQALEDCLVRWCPAYHPAPTARGAHVGDSGDTLRNVRCRTDALESAP